MLECKVNSNPIDSIDWYKNKVATTSNHQHQHRHKSRHNQESETNHSMEPLVSGNNIRIDKQDISTINDYQKTLLTLTVLVSFTFLGFFFLKQKKNKPF